MAPIVRIAAAAAALTWSGGAWAAEIHVAVAANFTAPAREIAAAFERATGDRAVPSFGSTGQLYAQIAHGAPFEVFLAADEAHPRRALEEGLAVPGSRFTYAVGRIVLWSRDPGRVTGPETLKAGQFGHIAIANPETAPYGAAAVQTMKKLGIFEPLLPKLVQGASIAQTFQFVETGNAELGFVALSQLAGDERGSRWLVPADLYEPIRQDAVLLKRGAESGTAKAFLTFLKGPEAARIIAAYGYGPGAAE